MTNKMRRSCTRLICAALWLISIGSAQADTYLMSRLPDPDSGLTKEATDALEAKANAGDWEIKQHFVIAYLYEYLSFFSQNQGCKTLKHGGYCRALAEHPQAGRRFLEEIVELEGKGPVYQTNLAAIQAQYASYWLIAARLGGYTPESIACRKAVRYYEKAIENERSTWNGRSCTAGELGNMAWYGLCMPTDKDKAANYWKYSHGCPQY